MPVTACLALPAGLSGDLSVYPLAFLLCGAQGAAFGNAPESEVSFLVLGENPFQYRRAMPVP